MKNVKKILFNTILLTGASFLMQTVSVSFNVYLTNKIGASGIGLYQLIMTVYSMAVTFSCAGIRLGSTRRTIDIISLDENIGVNKTMWQALRYALCSSSIISAAMIFFAPIIAEHWLNDGRTILCLRTLALCLPFVAMSSAMNGYFTATRTVFKSALVQACEQAVKIIVVINILEKMIPMGIEYSCLGIIIGALAGEIFSFVFLFALLLMSKYMRKRRSDKASLKKLLHITVPDAIGSGARSILLTIEHLLIPVGFKKSGQSPEMSLQTYGTINGMAFPILLYPSAALSSLSGLLVPELAQCKVRKQEKKINEIVERILSISLLYGICVGGIIYAFAKPISYAIYGNHSVAIYFQLLSPLVPIMYLDMSVDGMLKGLDQQLYSMRYNIFDSAICVILVWILLPRYAIKGYIIVLFVSEIINFYLSLRRLIKVVQHVTFSVSKILKPILCIGVSTSATIAFSNIFNQNILESKEFLILSVIISVIIYFVSLYLIGGIEKKDISLFKSAIC